jgi:superfamily II DNA or RNA helicase
VIETREHWRAGQRISVRGQLWTIVERTPFADCDAIHMRGAEPANRTATRTVLLPFDRPRPMRVSSVLRVMRPRRWLHALYGEVVTVKPFGGLSSSAGCPIAFHSYQLEPSLSMLRDGHTRVLIADAVGLGKTIQAGLLLRELATEQEFFRALVIVPAGLRDQWADELEARFALAATIATSNWLARAGARLPADINPWSLPGIYVASFDFIKRPEALRPLEEIGWDVVVVDEAHAATAGTARHAAVDAVARRARRVVLLSATPHGGDPVHFRALCGIGGAESPPAPLLVFNRSRTASGAASRRRTVLLPVHLSDAERRMHRALEAYTSQLCAESRSRGDAQARLAAIVLAKRALSSPASLARSCRRRHELLASGGAARTDRQLDLPLGDEDPLEDEEPTFALAAPGLTDGARERRWLAAIAEAADDAGRDESKVRVLLRLLRRTTEPAIVFTEYRDTLERLQNSLVRIRRQIVVLHGGMTPYQRTVAQREFNASDSLLLATDAAAEGLNLHHRCRLVVHFELPWNPSRLEQRAGRVDRIGQQRTVHEIVLVADDTAERLVLAPLAMRAGRARDAIRGRGLFEVLTESRIAAAVMEGAPLQMPPGEESVAYAVPSTELEREARREAARLEELSTWFPRANRHEPSTGIPTTALRLKGSALPPGIICLYRLSITAVDGNLRHDELIAVHVRWPVAAIRYTAAALRCVVDAFRQARTDAIEQTLQQHAAARVREIAHRCEIVHGATRAREQTIASSRRSTAQQLVQAGLFERRTRLSDARDTALLEKAGERRESIPPDSPLTPTLGLSAILVVSASGRA